MLNANHGALRRLAGLALAGGIAAVGVALAAPASADEPKTQRKEVRTVIVTNDSTGEGGATWNGEKMETQCPGTLTVIDTGPTGTEQKKEQQKIVLCTKGGSNEETAKALEHALETVANNNDMSAGAKAELTAKLKAKIAELRAGK